MTSTVANVDYFARIDAASTAAEQGDASWNVRYRAGLSANGLALIPYEGQQLDANGPVFAPLPVDGPDAWPTSLIVDAE